MSATHNGSVSSSDSTSHLTLAVPRRCWRVSKSHLFIAKAMFSLRMGMQTLSFLLTRG